MSEPKVAVVDGANVAYCEKSKNGEPRAANLVAVRRELLEQGYDPIIIVDASLRHAVDDAALLESLIDDQTVRQAPAGTDADWFVLETASQQNGIVVSNDTYAPFREEYPWIRRRRLPLMIIDGAVQLYEHPDED